MTDTKRVAVRDTKHLLAKIDREEGAELLVDLGPVQDVAKWDVSEGTELEAKGPLAKVGDKRVVVAQTATIDGQSLKIQRDTRQISGRIADFRTADVRGNKTRMVILSTGKDKKMLVDLGPVKKLDVDLHKDNRLAVEGVPVKIGDRRLLVAHVIRHDGKKTT